MFGGQDYKYPISIRSFDGGKNSKAQTPAVPLNQSPDCLNTWFDDYGAVGTVSGYSILNTAPIGSAVVDGLHSFISNSGTARLLAVCGGALTKVSGITETSFVTVASSDGIYTAGVDVKIGTFDNFAVLINGYVPAYKYDGTAFTRFGVVPPTSACVSAVCSAAGLLTGSYRYAFTTVNTWAVESNYSAVTTALLTVASGQINLSIIPTSPVSHGVMSINIYRNTAGATSGYWKVTSITNGTSLFTDNTPDTSLVTAAPTDNGIMPYCRFAEEYNAYMFGAGNPAFPMRLYWSKQGIRESWESDSFQDIGKGDGYPITSIKRHGNALMIHKNDGQGNGSVWMLNMPDSLGTTGPENWYIVATPLAYSAQSDKAMAFFNNLLFYINKTGAYASAGQDLAINSADGQVGRFSVDQHSFDIEPDWLAFKNTLLSKAACINFEGKLWLAVPYQAASTVNDRIFIYDYVLASQGADRTTGAWAPVSGPSVNNFTDHGGTLMGGSSIANGYVYKMDTGTSFAGSTINSYYFTPEIYGPEEHRDYTKVWRFLELTVECSGDWPLTVTYINDAKGESGKITTINLNDDNDNDWNGNVWNGTVWSAGQNRVKKRIGLNGCVGKCIQFKFSTNTVDQYWKLHELEIRYTLKGKR